AVIRTFTANSGRPARFILSPKKTLPLTGSRANDDTFPGYLICRLHILVDKYRGPILPVKDIQSPDFPKNWISY
ncbi:MAG: hypothetical protein ACNA7H_06590, partial [Desulfotignum sp.]